MPEAVVLFLQAKEDGVIKNASGQHAQGLWLNQWHEIDPQVGDALHGQEPAQANGAEGQKKQLRPYTVSPLFGLGDTKFGKTPVRAGEKARLRLTTLDDAHLPRILDSWLFNLPDDAPLSGLTWQRERRRVAVHKETYAALRGRYREAGHVPERWQVNFKTAAAFHLADKCYLPLPLPEKMVGSWLDFWAAFGQLPLLEAGDKHEAFLQRIATGLLLSRFENLKTVSFRFNFQGEETPQIGFVGDVTLDGRNLNTADRQVVATLADYAYYCGTGHHTTMGMGQTRARPVS